MRFSTRTVLVLLILVATAGLRAAPAASRHVIVCGSGGDEEYAARFAEWGQRLETVLVERLEWSGEDVVRLPASSATTASDALDLETIRSAVEAAADTAGPDDDLFVYLIGHGSHLRGVSRFHIPGPDLTAEALGGWLEGAGVRRVVIVNAASSSAGFINALSGPGRIVCTATKSVDERNATEFMEYFVQALEDGSADQNRDERISVLEACRQAAVLTEAYYVGQGLISTEHGLIDDNGDGRGTRLAEDVRDEPTARSAADDAGERRDGDVAAACFLKDFSFPPEVPREQVERYLSLLESVEDLKRQKASMDSAAYYAQLEKLLIEAARVHWRIRAAGER